MSMLIFSSPGCSTNVVRDQSRPQGYPIAPDVFTTLQRTVVPGPKPSAAIPLEEVSKYKPYGYGHWHYGNRSTISNILNLPFLQTQDNWFTNVISLLNKMAKCPQ